METWTGEALRTRSVTFVDSRATALEHYRHMRKDTAGDSSKADREKNTQRKKMRKVLKVPDYDSQERAMGRIDSWRQVFTFSNLIDIMYSNIVI